MTEFEQQVADALSGIHESWCSQDCDCQGTNIDDRISVALARRVAAALLATAQAAHERAVANVQSIPTLIPTDAGLIALQGEKS